MLECKLNADALASLKEGLFKSRANNKLNKGAILNGLTNYALYGSNNPFNYTLSETEINAITAGKLVDMLHQLFQYQHKIIYYGPLTLAQFSSGISAIHKIPASFASNPSKTSFKRIVQQQNKVLFADYDMVQSEIRWVRNAGTYNPEQEATINMFNDYFGGGMGSIVFQNIRESKALAYSTFALYNKPNRKNDSCYVIAYVGCQADKMNDAIKGMNELLHELPESRQAFNIIKQSTKKNLASNRIEEDDRIFTMLSSAKKDIFYDIRQKSYEQVDNIQFSNLQKFYKHEMSDKPYTYCIVGSEKKINKTDLEKFGDVKILSLEEIFGY